MVWTLETSRGFEQDKIKYETIRYTGVGCGLDLGCGPKRIWPNSIGIDQAKSPGGATLIGDITDLSSIKDESFPWVFSSHALEDHPAERNVEILRDWFRVVQQGGHLVLYLPSDELYPRVGEFGANKDHKQNLNPGIVIEAMREAWPSWDLVENQLRGETDEYSFYQVFRKTEDGQHRQSWREARRPSCKTVCVCRFGGFGDMIQTSGVLPGLKRQGFHVTVMTTPRGRNIIAQDPHVDDWILQDTDQVPNQELDAYWRVWAKKFDRFVNLSESVEGSLLAMPGRANHAWPPEMRHKYLNRNYGEFCADIAGVPYKSDAKFYPTEDETRQASELIAECANVTPRAVPILVTPPRCFTILWVLAGSSIHKTYPWMDNVIAAVLTEIPSAVIIMVGDEASQILEGGWEAEPRVRRLSGKLPIRETLALAQQVDCVVGPETGVLNAVAFEGNAKVVMLSHSSKENLSKHWTNTCSIEPPYVTCRYPCHRLHYGDEFCPLHQESMTAMCQAEIAPDRVFDAIAHSYRAMRLRSAA